MVKLAAISAIRSPHFDRAMPDRKSPALGRALFVGFA
jgi:hypothetical protein